MLGPLPARPFEPMRYADPATRHPAEIVTDETLRLFTSPKPEYQTGTITDEDQAILSMILPDVMAELLEYRKAQRGASS